MNNMSERREEHQARKEEEKGGGKGSGNDYQMVFYYCAAAATAALASPVSIKEKHHSIKNTNMTRMKNIIVKDSISPRETWESNL